MSVCGRRRSTVHSAGGTHHPDKEAIMHVVSSESQRPVMPGRAVARAQSRPLAAREPEKKKAAPLEPKVADRLLDLLSTDNAFRRLFKKDPQAALVKAGWEPEPNSKMASPAWCLGVERLASKEQIIESKAALRQHLIAGLGMTPIQLNVATTASRRVRK
jgi:putative modified peptide